MKSDRIEIFASVAAFITVMVLLCIVIILAPLMLLILVIYQAVRPIRRSSKQKQLARQRELQHNTLLFHHRAH